MAAPIATGSFRHEARASCRAAPRPRSSSRGSSGRSGRPTAGRRAARSADVTEGAAVDTAHVRVERPVERHALDAVERQLAGLLAVLDPHARSIEHTFASARCDTAADAGAADRNADLRLQRRRGFDEAASSAPPPVRRCPRRAPAAHARGLRRPRWARGRFAGRLVLRFVSPPSRRGARRGGRPTVAAGASVAAWRRAARAGRSPHRPGRGRRRALRRPRSPPGRATVRRGTRRADPDLASDRRASRGRRRRPLRHRASRSGRAPAEGLRPPRPDLPAPRAGLAIRLAAVAYGRARAGARVGPGDPRVGCRPGADDGGLARAHSPGSPDARGVRKGSRRRPRPPPSTSWTRSGWIFLRRFSRSVRAGVPSASPASSSATPSARDAGGCRD